jgi:hypothetical protein
MDLFRSPARTLGLVVFAALVPSPAPAETRAGTETLYMPFEACLARIPELAKRYGADPVPQVETDAVRLVRWRTPDASIIVICNRVEGSMITTVTPLDCGSACERRPFPLPGAPRSR